MTTYIQEGIRALLPLSTFLNEELAYWSSIGISNEEVGSNVHGIPHHTQYGIQRSSLKERCLNTPFQKKATSIWPSVK